MVRIDLNQLPHHSQWPSRLLGLSPWTRAPRILAKVDQEYDKEKYAACLAYASGEVAQITPEDVRHWEVEKAFPTRRMVVSRGADLFVADPFDIPREYLDLLDSAMREAISTADAVIELGCGYGYNLWCLQQRHPSVRWLGGECSDNAVRLAAVLCRDRTEVQVMPFNYYDSEYDVLGLAGGQRVVLFTSHSVEQLPSAMPFLETLSQYRQVIGDVFHFEPVCELCDDSLLGLLRRRYTECNDYNRDLLTALRSRPDVHILWTEAAVLGRNPLNPTSVIHWRFTEAEATRPSR